MALDCVWFRPTITRISHNINVCLCSFVALRLTTKQPQLSSDERAIKVRLEIPESLFKTPQLEFNVSVPENSVTPQILPVEVQDNIKSIIEQQTGCVVKLNVVDKLNPDDEQS